MAREKIQKPKKHLIHLRVNRSLGGNIAIFSIVFLFAAFMVLPLLYAVFSAFKPLDEIYIFPPRFFPKRPTRDNFVQLKLLADSFWIPLSKYIFNSVFVSVVATVGHLLLSSMAAYPLAKLHFAGKKTLNSVVKLSLLFTSAAMLIPQYIVMAELNIVNTYWAYILPALQSALGLYLMINFMSMVPESMLEAARIDGAGEWRIWWSIVMPNIKPAWLTVMVFTFQSVWNTTGTTQMSTLVYDEKIKMVSSLLSQVVAGGTARAGAGAALGLLLMLPPVLIFLFSQSKIIETMSASGMK
ncbi:MAG: carbohydrate ABC transporter permease [Oscillospiraceae bacterium]|nr:carbohydrate ABC transporter permease [Oscillospiraceae bacterium]